MSRRERALWLAIGAGLMVSALVEMLLPRSPAPLLVAQLWMGATLTLIGLLFWPPGGPGSPPALTTTGAP